MSEQVEGGRRPMHMAMLSLRLRAKSKETVGLIGDAKLIQSKPGRPQPIRRIATVASP